MKITTKALRTHTREILECLDRGESVTMTYRGKDKAKLISVKEKKISGKFPVFGMWADRKDLSDVDSFVRELRKGRFHAN